MLNDSTLAVAVYPRGSFEDLGEGLYRVTQQVIRYSPETGELSDTIASYAGFDGFIVPGGDMAPLYRRAGHVAVREGYVLVGTADSMEYSVYSGAGRLEQIVRILGYDLTVSDEDLAAERAALLPADGNAPPGYFDAVASLPSPKTRPAYQNLIVDNLGNVWAAEYHGLVEADAQTDWLIFSPDGQWLGTVGVPARFTVYEIGADYVLGRWRDENDVEHVQLLELTR